MDPYTVLVEAARPHEVDRVRDALERAGIPFRSGLLVARSPKVIFSVPQHRLEEARAAIGPMMSPDHGTDPTDEDDDDLYDASDLVSEGPARFPLRPVQAVGVLALVHLAFGLVIQARGPAAAELLRWGSLQAIAILQPWRFVTSLFLHADPTHALWNGLSMVVFAVPLIQDLGYRRTAGIYLASGIGGGIAALAFARPGTMIIGSSGAVAGLFGAWVALTMMKPLPKVLPWRARIRTIGVALLVIPSLLTPVTATGRPVSVSSHVGGLLTGMAIGAAISTGLLRKLRGAPIEIDGADNDERYEGP